MRTDIGIDLGTTNSAICSYDGNDTRIWKSPEQNDVTPSAILIDRRGNKYLGNRAYNSAPWQDGNAALLFKRMMGTSTPIRLSAVNITMTPEECSAEILKLLFGYLPEEIRNDPDTGTVITVPAAFNQMQKDATMQASELAAIGKVALMQEPVAAVMSVMRVRNTDGMFLIYDLGGGTLDIAIAESIGGRVNLLAHGGIAMCGGRDFDRVLVDNVVKPWLLENFDLPEDLSANPQFKTLIRVATWATERAKIELSAKEEAAIILSEDEMRCKDLSGADIYLEIPLNRETLDRLIPDRIAESINAARETMTKAGISSHDLERIVFVGGPTHYKPLRDKVSFELGIPASTDVNPMTAVAEGASLFAESVDWGTKSRARKTTRGEISSGGPMALTFKYVSRTPSPLAKIAVQLTGQVNPGTEFQIDNLDTGWTSGRIALKNGAIVDVTLSKSGDNTFKVFVFDSSGGPMALGQDRIVITRTAATVDAIPASHSISIEILGKLGGRPILDYLVREGDSLPVKGNITYKAAETLKAGSSGSINIKLWEGDIDDPITDNRLIGVLKISGSDFTDGVIHAGANLECEYEILDSGNILISVSVPCIRGSFDSSGKNFYSRREGLHDYLSECNRIIEDAEMALDRLDSMSQSIKDARLQEARGDLESAICLDPEGNDPERAKEADDKILKSRKLLARVKKDHLKEVRENELEGVSSFFNDHIREHARPSEATAFDNLVRTARRSIERNDPDFESQLDELKGKNFEILWRQDWFVVERFKEMSASPHRFSDRQRFTELVNAGMQYLRADQIDQLRSVVVHLYQIMIRSGSEDQMFDAANILRG